MSVTAGQHPRCLLLAHLHTFTRVTSADRAVFLTAASKTQVKAAKASKVFHAVAEEPCAGREGGMRLRENEVRFLSLLEQTGRGASPRRSENTAKKGIKPPQSAASLASCQTIPVKALFRWRPEQQTFGECKEKNVYREEDTLNLSCALGGR